MSNEHHDALVGRRGAPTSVAGSDKQARGKWHDQEDRVKGVTARRKERMRPHRQQIGLEKVEVCVTLSL
jgi:hypothetical protein